VHDPKLYQQITILLELEAGFPAPTLHSQCPGRYCYLVCENKYTETKEASSCISLVFSYIQYRARARRPGRYVLDAIDRHENGGGQGPDHSSLSSLAHVFSSHPSEIISGTKTTTGMYHALMAMMKKLIMKKTPPPSFC